MIRRMIKRFIPVGTPRWGRVGFASRRPLRDNGCIHRFSRDFQAHARPDAGDGSAGPPGGGYSRQYRTRHRVGARSAHRAWRRYRGAARTLPDRLSAGGPAAAALHGEPPARGAHPHGREGGSRRAGDRRLPRSPRGAALEPGRCLYNGEWLGEYAKQALPNYEVFDEQRYFAAGSEPLVLEHKGLKLGLLICEDLWDEGPARRAREAGA